MMHGSAAGRTGAGNRSGSMWTRGPAFAETVQPGGAPVGHDGGQREPPARSVVPARSRVAARTYRAPCSWPDCRWPRPGSTRRCCRRPSRRVQAAIREQPTLNTLVLVVTLAAAAMLFVGGVLARYQWAALDPARARSRHSSLERRRPGVHRRAAVRRLPARRGGRRLRGPPVRAGARRDDVPRRPPGDRDRHRLRGLGGGTAAAPGPPDAARPDRTAVAGIRRGMAICRRLRCGGPGREHPTCRPGRPRIAAT